MPHEKRIARERSRLPAPEAAALGALSVSESLVLAMVESGSLDPQVLRRCLLDAAAAHERLATTKQGRAGESQAIHAETARLIDSLLRQVDAVAPLHSGTNSFAKDSTKHR